MPEPMMPEPTIPKRAMLMASEATDR
jgi:hypothetical protein